MKPYDMIGLQVVVGALIFALGAALSNNAIDAIYDSRQPYAGVIKLFLCALGVIGGTALTVGSLFVSIVGN